MIDASGAVTWRWGMYDDDDDDGFMLLFCVFFVVGFTPEVYYTMSRLIE